MENIENIEINYKNQPKFKIVFMPYKASMWDSLESVWKAAYADWQCDAVVVPIPYYEKNEDGSFGKMCYEGDLYPAEVPVVNWLDYDLATQRPDIIFIHNPYDNSNLITSVHPDYYSGKLKQYGVVAYVNYGVQYRCRKVYTENIPNITPPAEINADVVFVYSKYLAEFLTAKLTDIMKGLGAVIDLSGKFVPLGSPKFDKVINDSALNYEPPDDLKSIYINPAGKKKKIILYNLSISTLLKNTNAYFRRLKNSLVIFERHKDDIVLWLRPHPLFVDTIKKLRPMYLSFYNQIINNFINGKWGVYDDTPNPHRAIAWSDAYFGDESSLLFLFLAAGKPFTMQAYLGNPVSYNGGTQFHAILEKRIENMRQAKGANIFNKNQLIAWENFATYDYAGKIQYKNFIARYIHFIVNPEKYPNAALYKDLCREMFNEFVANTDGTAGISIYKYCKEAFGPPCERAGTPKD